MPDPFNLERFVNAQNPIFDEVVSELRQGRKTTHWIWFIFSQLKGLGTSSMSARYGISSQPEAKAYLDHPILGPRLIECTEIVNAVEGRSIEEIFGGIDSVKFRSSMTLFSTVSQGNRIFQDALDKYFDGESDKHTVKLLQAHVQRQPNSQAQNAEGIN
jgi:uncharacterized protein (DUF1810 family)